jgi:hypothetical protein
MAYDENLVTITLPAASGIASKTGVSGVDTATGSDHGGKQYHFVKVDSSGNAALGASGTSEVIIGVLQNKPQVAGAAATIATGGISRAVVGATAVAAGDAVKVSSTGAIIPVGTLATDLAAGIVVGVALKAGATGAIVPVALRIS